MNPRTFALTIIAGDELGPPDAKEIQEDIALVFPTDEHGDQLL